MRPFFLVLFLCSCFVVSACGDSTSCEDLNCDDGSPCTTDSCEPTRVACDSAPVPDATDCTVDGDAGLCSAGACASLSCDGGSCDDANPCTVDACFPGTANCAHFRAPELSICQVGELSGSCREGNCDLDEPPSGEAALEVVVGGVEPGSVSYQMECERGVTLSGSLARSDNLWQAFLILPAGECSATFSARDQDGEVICLGNLVFQVVADTSTEVGVVLICSV